VKSNRRVAAASRSAAVVHAVESLEARRLFHTEFAASINFQPPGVPVPEGYLPDYGDAFGRHANGLSYGWDQHNYNARNRRGIEDVRYRTLNYMQLDGNRSWEIAVPEAGVYAVRVVAGDGQYIGGRMRVAVEGMLAVSDRITPERPYVEGVAVVEVTDGRITLTNASRALQNKLAFVEVTSFHGSIVNVKPDQPLATESGQAGSVRVTRMGDLLQPLTVRYSLAGTAANGVHFESLPGAVTIPAGRSWAAVRVVPLDDSQRGGDRDVQLTILDDDAYQLGVQKTAAVTIRDDGLVAPDPQPEPEPEPQPQPSVPAVVRVNFQPDGTAVAPFHRVDSGAVYGVRSNGLTYGWNASNATSIRDRVGITGDRRYDTFNHLQKNGDFRWEMAVPNGTYTVRVVAGDASFNDSTFRIAVEGVLTVSGTPTASSRFVEGTQTVTVADGRLTIANASGAVNNKIAFVEIASGSSPLAVVTASPRIASATEGGGGFASVRITRTGSLASDLLVGYAVAGSAAAGSDYAALGGTITIPAGMSFADVVISPIDDSVVEGPETVTIAVNPSEAYSTALQAPAAVTILDNDTSVTNTITWTNVAGPAQTYSETLSAVVNGKWYLFGGFPSTFQPVKVAYRYDPATRVYTRIADLPEAITHAPALVHDGKVFIVGGYVGRDTGGQTFGSRKIWIYDTATNTYARGPDLPEARAGGGGAVVNGFLHYFGGENLNRTADTATHWRLNLANVAAGWQTMAPMPAPRNHLSAIAHDGKIYALGGQTGFDRGLTARAEMWAYDPATNAWSARRSLPEIRSHFSNAMFTHAGRLYVFGGETAHNVPVRSAVVYDFASDTWSSLSPMPRNRMSAAVAYLDGAIHVVGGYYGSIQTQAWRGVLS
jgi:N-acetylneuraminic acid mutarotase